MAEQNVFHWFSKVFEPPVDFYGVLIKHAETTLAGMEELNCWILEGAEERCQKVRDLEQAADVIKLDLQRKLVEAFVTPFDREDIYDLSNRLDEVINSAKATVREIEALSMPPDDSFVKEMVATLVEGSRCLLNSFSNLKDNLPEAERQAVLARKAENRLSRLYRQAMRELFEIKDLKRILRTVEIYRSLVIAAEHIDSVGAKLQHVIVKII